MSKHLFRLVLLVAFGCLAIPAPSYGQELGDYEVFGGFSAYYPGIEPNVLGSLWMYGAMGELTWFATDWFGITGEVGYQTGSLEIPRGIWFCGQGTFCEGGIDVSQTTFLVGMRFRYPNSSRFVPAGRVAMGVGHANAGVRFRGRFLDLIGDLDLDTDVSDNAFTVALGGSLDLNVNDRIAVRVIQPDIVITTYGSADADIRLSTGLIVRF